MCQKVTLATGSKFTNKRDLRCIRPGRNRHRPREQLPIDNFDGRLFRIFVACAHGDPFLVSVWMFIVDGGH
jgi:hypothetical protein